MGDSLQAISSSTPENFLFKGIELVSPKQKLVNEIFHGSVKTK